MEVSTFTFSAAMLSRIILGVAKRLVTSEIPRSPSSEPRGTGRGKGVGGGGWGSYHIQSLFAQKS